MTNPIANPFADMYGDLSAIGKKISDMRKDDKMPRSEICENLRKLYQSNGDYFISSQLSWIEKLYH